ETGLRTRGGPWGAGPRARSEENGDITVYPGAGFRKSVQRTFFGLANRRMIPPLLALVLAWTACLVAPRRGRADGSVDARVTLALRAATVDRALPALFEPAGLRYRLELPGAGGSITTNLRDVPFRQALRLVLRQAQPPLGYRIDDGVYVITPLAAPAT